MKIFINPGHSGTDPGACGCGLREVDVVLKIGRRVENYLRAVGYDVKLFQYDSLQEICDASNVWHSDLFVSIHCNAANNIARGTETFHYEYSTNGKRLANFIQRQIVSSVGTYDRGLKTKLVTDTGVYDPYVVKYTDCPAVLVETAFIDNYADAKLLVDREDDFARAIARGITDYFDAERPLPDVVDVPTRAKRKFAR